MQTLDGVRFLILKIFKLLTFELFKEVVCVISSDPLCKYEYARITTVPVNY